MVAGEASGDLHGSNLMRGIYAEDRDADCRFWGGELMNGVYKEHQDGIGLVHDYKDGAVIGFVQIILNARKFLGRLGDCCKDILAWKPDVVILIDYPGFNFRVAEFAHDHGIKTFYYIAPKVWASRESRVKKLKKYVDKLFIVFPFEKEYFTRKGVDYIYEGNPLIDAVDNYVPKSQLSLPEKPYIAILAGSRKGEVGCMMPVCVKFADMMRELPQYRDWEFVVAGAPSRSLEDYSAFIGDRKYISVKFGATYDVVRGARAAVVNSGTASLETCLLDIPQVVAYSGAEVNFNIARHIIKIDCISLGNLILGRKAFRELMQYYFTPQNVLTEVRRLLEDGEYREGMLADYAEIRRLLGGSGASRAVARAMVNELG